MLGFLCSIFAMTVKEAGLHPGASQLTVTPKALKAFIRLKGQMPEVSPLMVKWMSELDAVEGDVLDLACGNGQNGLFVAQRDSKLGRRNRKVILLDRNVKKAVECTVSLPGGAAANVEHLEVDLETAENPSPLPIEAFGAVLVFSYLHRPLLPNLRDAVKPGGLVLYKTYTSEHPSVGLRPSNPAFLLRPGELKDIFDGWEVLDFFEGIEEVVVDAGGKINKRAVSSIVCRKLGPRPSEAY